MDVPLDVAFAEACRALGEAVVRERLLTAELQRLRQPPPQPDENLEDGQGAP